VRFAHLYSAAAQAGNARCDRREVAMLPEQTTTAAGAPLAKETPQKQMRKAKGVVLTTTKVLEEASGPAPMMH